MKKIAILTTAFARPEITLFHMKWMQHFKSMNIVQQVARILPLYVLSSYDKHRTAFEGALGRHGLKYIVSDAEKLSTKAQQGIEHLKRWEFDYLMHLDSDEFMCERMLLKWADHMERGTDWIAAVDQIKWLPRENKMLLFTGFRRQPYVNGGNTISRAILDAVQWNLWTAGLEFGLNKNEYLRLKDAGFAPALEKRGTMGTVEVKIEGTEQIHPIEWFTEKKMELEELGGIQTAQVKQHHGFLINNFPSK